MLSRIKAGHKREINLESHLQPMIPFAASKGKKGWFLMGIARGILYID